jgi:L-2-hydroxyglutarate oxidase LhgO
MDVDAVVIGAGCVGLSCAAALARNGGDVLVLEAADAIGTGVSSRNSEVIHGGMYYPHNSLRRRFCIEGRRKLYAYLAERKVAHRKTGKLIVATSDAETPQIEAIYRRGLENGVENMTLIDGKTARGLEPNLACTAALLSPETGVIDSHGYMLALQGEIEDAGGAVALQAPVTRIVPINGGYRVMTGGAQPASVETRKVVNCAALNAQAVARAIEGLKPEHIPALYLAKGNYYTYAGRPAFTRLIYPAPVEGGLGVHVTLDLAGRMRFGPDVEWLNTDDPAAVDYAVDKKRADSFYAAIRTYWPGLPDGALAPDYSGLRPKLSGRGQPAQDFRIDGPEVHGLPGLINLFGIESPGLTSSPAIAEDVARRLAD